MVNNVLDLTDRTLNEDQFLFEIKRAFDSGDRIEEVKLNSDSALNLQASVSLSFTTDGIPQYCSVFGAIELTVVSAQALNQTTIDTHSVDAIQ